MGLAHPRMRTFGRGRMSAITIAARLEKKLILMSRDEALKARLREVLPEGWTMVETLDLASLGEFQDILVYRFMLLDLDALSEDFDPQDQIRAVRMDMMLNLPIFCFGGSADERDAARLNRADRFFEREEMAQRLPQFCAQYAW